MKNSYFVEFNGLYFSFDFIRRMRKSKISFYYDNKYICSLNLDISRLVFRYKDIESNTCYFEIVPIGGK